MTSLLWYLTTASEFSVSQKRNRFDNDYNHDDKDDDEDDEDDGDDYKDNNDSVYLFIWRLNKPTTSSLLSHYVDL